MRKYLNILTIAIAAFFAINVSSAAVTHNTTLYGDDIESLWLFDSEWNSYYDFSDDWSAEVFVQDDADGYINFTYSGGFTVWYIQYTVSANAETWTLTSPYSSVTVTAAMMEVINLLYPL